MNTGLFYLVNGGGFETTSLAALPPPFLAIKLKINDNRPILSQSFLQEKFIKEGLKIEQIAELSNSSRYLVKKALKATGLIQQKQLEQMAIREKSKPRDEIKRLRDSGLSMRSIADEMVKLNYKNSYGGKIWHPMMIQRLLNN